MKTYQLLFIRFLIILSVAGFSIYIYQIGLVFTAIFGILLVFILISELYFYLKNTFGVYDKTIASILQNDFTSNFSKHKSNSNYSNLFQLYENLKEKQYEQVSRDIIYQSILNTIETGILILQKEGSSWNIFLMNDYFSKHFQVPKVTKWGYLKNQLPELCNFIELQDFQELKTSLEIRVNEQDTQTFVMQTSRSEIYQQEFCVVLLDSIQNVIDKKEKEAWGNLMKTISHELLNSITPIRSLSQNLQEVMLQETISTEDLDDMKSCVATMLRRSDHLQQFVESYRKLAMLPSPKKEKTELSKWIENSCQIMKPLFEKERIQVIDTTSFNRWLHIDPVQMEQVLINLFTNCIYSLKDILNKQIIISAEIKENRTFIMITDNGKGIEKEIESKIFLPFFTTRKEGAGIGLTLSKNIVEAHGGYLSFKKEEGKTTFVICLIDA